MEISWVKEKADGGAVQLLGQKPTEKAKPPIPKESEKLDHQAGEENIKALTENINSFMKSMSYSLEFILDKQNGEVVIKVLDGEGNLVRRIPPETAAALAKMGARTGVVVNEILE